MFDPVVARVITAISTISGLAGLLYLVLEHENLQGDVRGSSFQPLWTISCTTLFLLLGPWSVLLGQRRIKAFALKADVRERPGQLNSLITGGIALVAAPFTIAPYRSISDSGAFPMPNGWATAAYCLAAIGVVVLCSQGIYTAATFLECARQYGERGRALEVFTDPEVDGPYRRAHVYVAWTFSMVGALQMPLLLSFAPALPRSSQIAGGIFTAALFLIGPLLFWLPRRWQQAKLKSELGRIVRNLILSKDTDEAHLIPAYEHCIAELSTTGLKLSLPAIAVASAVKVNDLVALGEALGLTKGS